MTTDNPTAVPPRGGARRGGAPQARAGAARQGQQTSFRARKRRRNQLLAGGIVGLVVIVIAVVVAIGLSSSSSSGPTGSSAVSAAQLSGIEAISPATMAAAEAGSATKVNNPPIAVGTTPATLTANGKPQVLYIGAEYCPYCAGERWAMVMALSKFGTWSNLHSITSAANDTPASIPTFTFVDAKYTSDLLDFTSVEQLTVDRKPLQKTSADQTALLEKYDNAPYVPSNAAGGIPFFDMGNVAVQDGLGFSDTSMQHVSFASIADQVANQSSPVGGSIAAEAGVLVSNLCQLTGGKDAVGGAACQAFPKAITQPPAGG